VTEPEISIGTHRVRVTGDTVLTRYIGVPEYEQVVEIHGHFDVVRAAYGRLFVINDMARSGIPSTQTRRFIAEWGSNNPGTKVVSFGASFPIRTLQMLILRASTLIGKRVEIVPEYVADEAAAYAWVDAKRAAAQRDELRGC